jgi:hypothetical protein
MQYDSLRRYARRHGLDIAKHAPGDGIARYRFELCAPTQPGDALPAPPRFHAISGPTVLGIRAAQAYVEGFADGTADR